MDRHEAQQEPRAGPAPRLRAPPGLAWVAAAAAAACAVLLLDAQRAGGLRGWELVHPLAAPAGSLAHAVAGALAALASTEALLVALLVLAARSALRRDWVEAYTALFTGLGLYGAAAVLAALLARVPPAGSLPFPVAGSFPHPPSTLALALAGLLAWRSRAAAGDRGWRPLLLGAGAVAVAAAHVLAGTAWPTDALAGQALAALWLALCLLGASLAARLLAPAAADPADQPLVGWLSGLGDRAAAWCDRAIAGRLGLPLALLALGVAVRLLAPWAWALGPDADRYAAMAHGLLETGTLTMAWGDVYSPGPPGPSHHFPPLYPAVLAGFYAVLGFGRDPTRVASIVLSLAAVAATYLCTRDLYGHRKGVVAAAAVAASPMLVLATNKGYAENLLLLLFVLTLWAILKSLRRPWFIVLGAAFAALGYLTKSSMGAFFVVAGLGGLAWRLHWKGWRVLKDPAYVTAILVFGAAVAAWAWRNLRLFGTWETSEHIGSSYANAVAHPGAWALLLPHSFAFLFGLGYLLLLALVFWLPQLRRIPLLADEHDSGLWLAAFLPLALTVPIDAALWLLERDFFVHNVRYVSFALVPLVWLLLRHARPSKATWLAVLGTVTLLAAGTLYYAIPQEKVENRLSAEWGPLVRGGDTVGFVGTNDVYRFYFDLTDDGRRELGGVRVLEAGQEGNATTDWVLVRSDGGQPRLPPGYGKVLEETGAGTARPVETYTLWRKG